MGWEEFNGISNAGAVGGADVDTIASVVIWGTANVVSFLAMDGPSAALFGGFMDEDFGAKGCHGFSVEVMDSMQDGIR